MKICIYNVNKDLNIRNNIFRKEAFGIGDDLGAPFRMLRQKLQEKGCSLETFDMRPLEEFDSFLFLDLPRRNDPVLKYAIRSGKILYLLLFECEVIRPWNYYLPYHSYFRKIFTWSPELASGKDQEKYIRYYWPNPLAERSKPLTPEERTGFCILMAGNKWSDHPKELYSERVRALQWFARNRPDSLDLYGPGWIPTLGKKTKETVRNCIRRVLGRPPRPAGWRPFSFYRGMATSKREVLRNYRFSICYENARGIPGYITEKIFDCFTAGVVPVYLGWDGALDLIPAGTYIDKGKFPSYGELYDHLEKMTNQEYNGYLKEIEDFLSSSEGQKFDISFFSDLLVRTIMEHGFAPG